MFRSILSLTFSLMASVVLLASPATAEPQVSHPPGTIVLARVFDFDRHDDWNDRTCCRREERGGYSIFWSTVRECRRSGGERVTNKECRKHGGFHRYERSEWHDRDGRYDQRGDDRNERICCTRNHQVWWSTRGECRRASGYETDNRDCRR